MLVWIYVVGAMLSSYVAPVFFAIVNKSWVWIIAIPVATSVIFAAPSSFVKEGACDAGFGEIAPWAMRSIPVWWFFEALNPNEPAIYCPA